MSFSDYQHTLLAILETSEGAKTMDELAKELGLGHSEVVVCITELGRVVKLECKNLSSGEGTVKIAMPR